MNYNTRERILPIMEEKKLDAIIIADEYNQRYLSGYRGGTGFVYMSKNQLVVLTDARYTLAAMEESEPYGFKVITISVQEGYLEKLTKLLKEDEVSTVGFEDRVMIYADVEAFEKKLPADHWVALGDSITRLRRIKTADEIEYMAQAEAIGDRAFTWLLGEIKPGITERDLAARLECYMRTHGAETISFDAIVASGIHSSMPHAVPTEKKLEDGDFITFDFGCKVNGYCSDMTRTVVLGKANVKQKEIYNIVLEAQLTGLATVRAGLTGRECDKVARDIIEKAGYGDCFGHSLGHSVGLQIHESPNCSPKEDTVLEPNMIETVEPGIYVPGFGGVRIEDMVVVQENGCRNLTFSPKELIEL